VPLRIGGGTRLKIFEALAMGKAVVSTSVGAEGLPVTGGEHVMVADSPETFAREIVHLLRDIDHRRRLETAARALVVERYDWSGVAGKLEHALMGIAGQTRGYGAAGASAGRGPSTQGALSALPDLHGAGREATRTT
jgi:glycosyltransferase involved in cell wall biosynthesis